VGNWENRSGRYRISRRPFPKQRPPHWKLSKTFSVGKKALSNGDYAASVLSFQRAIALDSDFALAYAGLAASYTNLGESRLSTANAKKAYELRERTSEREKLELESNLCMADYWRPRKNTRVNELLVHSYPRDSDAHFNLGNIYDNLRAI